MAPQYEVLDTRPERERDPRLVVLALVLALLVGGLLLAKRVRGDEVASEDCRVVTGAAWCTSPSEVQSDPRVVRLVRGYCPRLRSIPLAQVVPQPLSSVGLPGRRGELVLRTTIAGTHVETGLIGRPGHLAWLLRRSGGAEEAARLEMVCHEAADRVPALSLGPAQLRSALEADGGGGGLDLRVVAGRAAGAVRTTASSRVSLGTFGCRTGPAALTLQRGARFGCSLRLYSDQGQALRRLTFAVVARAPYVRLVA